MSLFDNLWRHKITLLTSAYFLLELLSVTFDLQINRRSWWYLTIVAILILSIIITAYQISTQNKVPA